VTRYGPTTREDRRDEEEWVLNNIENVYQLFECVKPLKQERMQSRANVTTGIQNEDRGSVYKARHCIPWNLLENLGYSSTLKAIVIQQDCIKFIA
jgi:hypothetical protein